MFVRNMGKIWMRVPISSRNLSLEVKERRKFGNVVLLHEKLGAGFTFTSVRNLDLAVLI
jgi:hypothetical protein